MKRNKWLDLVGSEVMDSRGAVTLINVAVGIVKDKVGEPESVLCVGCGDGTELEMWDNAQGIDLNEESLAKCGEAGFTVKKMDMHEMDFKDNKFELLFARDVFEHALSPIQAISEMARVSSKYVVIVVPDESWQDSKWHFIIPTLKQMIALAEKVDLKLLKYREYGLALGNQWVEQKLYIFEK